MRYVRVIIQYSYYLARRLLDRLDIHRHHIGAALGVGLLVVSAIINVVNVGTPTHTSALSVPSTPTVGVCGERAASDDEEYTGPALPSNADTQAIASINGYFRYWSGTGGQDARWYSYQPVSASQATFEVYDAVTNTQLSTFTVTIPSAQQGQHLDPTFAVNPTTGDVYIGSYATQSYGGIISEWSWTTGNTTASEVWDTPTTGLIYGGIYGYIDSASVFRVAAVVANGSISEAYSNTFDGSTGEALANNVVIGTDITVATDHNNDIVSADNNNPSSYVRIYNAAATTQTFYVGTSGLSAGTNPFHFYTLTSATELSNGDIVVADSGHGLDFLDPTGVLLGIIGDDISQSAYAPTTPSITSDSSIEIENGNIYYETGAVYGTPQDLDYTSLSDAQLLYQAPQGAPYHFGIGAGLESTATDNYFPAGTAPSVGIEFFPWWTNVESNYSVSYTVRSIQQVEANQNVTPTTYSLSSELPAGSTSAVTIPVNLPAASPGFYEVSAQLLKSGTVVGADCLRYSVGASGDSFSPNTFPTGGDSQAVTVAADFNQTLVRSGYTIDDCLAGLNSVTAATTLHCPSDMISDVDAAASLAASDGVGYEIQVFGEASSLDADIISTGQLQRLTASFVAQFPSVNTFEAWNEMNNTYSGDATTLINSILEPFYNGVKASEPNATVVGGSVLGISTGLWQNIASDGGLQYMNAIGDHPYTGHNRSFEEQNQLGQEEGLQAILAAAGYPSMPIYDTESGFWSNGSDDYYVQGDKLIRKEILESSIGVNHSFNFTDIDNYTISGEVWGLIDNSGLNPAGLASVTTHHLLGGRTFLHWMTSSIPHTYAALYGPSSSSSADVAVVWSDDYTVGAAATLSGGGSLAITNEYGGTSAPSSGSVLSLTGAVQYITVPSGQTLSIAPGESYGTNYAAASNGASATATSSYNCGSTSLAAANAIDQISDTEGVGDICDGNGMSVWAPAQTDSDPALTITFGASHSIDRVYVSGQGLGSVETGLRDFVVQVGDGSGTFTTVATVANNFYQRNTLVTFAPVMASQIRITGLAINYSGYGDGLPPIFWGSSFSSAELASIYTVEAYAPGTMAPTSGPTIAMTSPVAGANEHISPTLSASVLDNSGSGIAKVMYYANGNLIGSSSTSPYSLAWNTLPQNDGTYSLTAVGYDNDGNISTSSPVSVIVNNGDVNNDDSVNIIDLSLLASHYNASPASYAQGDLNGDGNVTINDLSILANHYGWHS